MSLRRRDALLALPVCAIGAQIAMLLCPCSTPWTFLFAAVSGSALAAYVGLEWRERRAARASSEVTEPVGSD